MAQQKLRTGGISISDVQMVLREAAAAVDVGDESSSSSASSSAADTGLASRRRTRQLYIELIAAVGALLSKSSTATA